MPTLEVASGRGLKRVQRRVPVQVADDQLVIHVDSQFVPVPQPANCGMGTARFFVVTAQITPSLAGSWGLAF